MGYESRREEHVHGDSWARQASGYFSDKGIARDYVAAIMRAVREFRPSVIADLGGGTGFILEQLIEAGIPEDVKLVVIDESGPQLAACRNPRIILMKGTLQSFGRTEVVREDERLMLICRSVLQYAGFRGQMTWLSRVRGEMRPGEWFVHQSGCTEDAEASRLLNRLFALMGVDKWVPDRDAFVQMLTEARLEVKGNFLMPPIGMVSEELAYRYGVSPENMKSIGAELCRTCAGRPDMFRTTPAGFVFNFPYRVFLCRAVE